jgi:acid phosphatase type 7
VSGGTALTLALVLGFMLLGGGSDQSRRATAPSARSAPLVAAAGDVACSPRDPAYNAGAGTATACRQRATSDLLLARPYDAVLALGDLQYPSGAGADFEVSYDASWGRVAGITIPVVGNHEYETSGAAGYFDYFGDRAGARGRGWHAHGLGTWRVVALNSNCGQVGCGADSPQLRWLRRVLRRDPRRCTLALMHRPRFSSGPHGQHGPNKAQGELWRALYRAGAEVILAGHDHLYERFAPQRPDGRLDRRHGITEFVVGTGGKSLYRFRDIRRHSVSRHREFGVLSIRLGRGWYSWRFLAAGASEVLDAGRRACH